MRFLFRASILAICCVTLPEAMASGDDQTSPNERVTTITRFVDLADKDGSTIKVMQVLRQLPDGSLEYDPSAQNTETRDYDARMCPDGSSPGKGVSVWAPDTLHGGACFQTFDSIDEFETWSFDHPVEDSQGTKLDRSSRAAAYIKSDAPGGYIIPVNVNAIHYGRGVYLLGANSMLEGVLLIDNRWVTRFREPVAGGSVGVANLRINVFHSTPGQVPKFVNFCANGLCNSASSQFTVF